MSLSPDHGAGLRRARASLEEATILFQARMWPGAVNRAYYAMFQAAMALLASRGEIPRTHKGVRLRLQELDLLDLEARAALARAQALREQSDYLAAIPADERDAVTTLADAKRFVERVEAALS